MLSYSCTKLMSDHHLCIGIVNSSPSGILKYSEYLLQPLDQALVGDQRDFLQKYIYEDWPVTRLTRTLTRSAVFRLRTLQAAAQLGIRVRTCFLPMLRQQSLALKTREKHPLCPSIKNLQSATLVCLLSVYMQVQALATRRNVTERSEHNTDELDAPSLCVRCPSQFGQTDLDCLPADLCFN